MKIRLRGEPVDGASFLEQILKNRGVDQTEEEFFDLDWSCVNSAYNLDFIREAAEKLIQHISNNSNIAILVDVDMDGYSSAALLINYIDMQKEYGDWQDYSGTITPLLHKDKIHGLNDTEIMRRLRDTVKPDLLIISDASGNNEQYKALVDLGIDIIVLDHHDMIERGDGDQVIVVNNQQSVYYSNKDLSGVGIVWQFCRVLDDLLSFACADKYLDLVALGNVADVMDLRSPETRFLVIEGLKPENIHSYFLQHCQFNLHSMQDKNYNPHNIGFYIAPLFNAVARIGTDDDKDALFWALIDNKATELVKDGTRGHTGTVPRVQEAIRLASNAKSRQDRRKTKLATLVEQVISEEGLAADKVIVLAFDDFEEEYRSLSGLTANIIADTYQRPCILTFKKDDGSYVGSLRVGGTNPAYHNFKDQCEASGCCSFVAGHQEAAGIGIKGGRVQDLIDYFNDKYEDIDADLYYDVDFIIDANDPQLPDLITTLDTMKNYWGQGLPEPLIAVTNVKIGPGSLSLVGAKQTTLWITTPTMKFISFNSGKTEYDSLMLPYNADLPQYYRATVIGKEPELNYFRDKVTPQMKIQDYHIEGVFYDF